MSKTVYVLNGPNLNLLGQRQPEIYGAETLADVEADCRAAAEAAGLGLDFRQSNHEGVLVDWIRRGAGWRGGDRHQSRRVQPHFDCHSGCA